MAPKQRNAAKEILLALDADPALIEHYDPNEIEAIPLASIRARLAELELTPAIPAKLQRILSESTPSPAADVLRVLLDDSEYLQPQSIEALPLAEVTTCLQRRGTNYRADVTAMMEFLGDRSSGAVGLDKDRMNVHSTKMGRFRTRKSLFLVTIGSAATATAAVAATVGFFITRETHQDKRIADQQYEIQELSGQVEGLTARLKELEVGADDLMWLTMLVPPGTSAERRTWLSQNDDGNAPTAAVGVRPEASRGGSSGDRKLDGDRSLADVAPPVGVGVAPETPLGWGSGNPTAGFDGAPSPYNVVPQLGIAPDRAPPGVGVGGLPPNAFLAFQTGAQALRAGDTKTAIEMLEHSARNGEVMAIWKLGRMYADGDGVKQNDLRAFDYFRTLADSHADPGTRQARFVANAFVALGRYYLTGIPDSEIKPDAVRAHEMFNYAGSYFGDPDAQYHLGRMYLDGQGIPKDTKQAVRWLSLAAGKGQYQAQAVFGALLFKGQYVPRDAARGLMWLTLARDAAPPEETWIVDLYNAAAKQSSEDERATALVHLEHWVKSH
jgi:uncharacterized protein